MQIRDIILYGEGERTRRLSLHVGQVNIITGASGTGKSALLHIVEYVLGRDDFLVPEGPISRTVRWYGLRFQFPNTQVFVARRSPDAWAGSTTETFFEIGADLSIPPQSALVANTNPKDLNQYLTRLLGISPNLNVPGEGETRRPLQATLRQALFYSFQAQTEIAKNNILFHRQDEQFIPQTIRDTIQYFLGAVSEDQVVKTQAHRRLKRELGLAERKAKEATDIQGKGIGRGIALITEAESVGLIPSPPEADFSSPDVARVREALASALVWTPEELPIIPDDVLSRLQSEYNRLMDENRRCTDRIRAARHCEEGQKGFEVEAREQRMRLAFVGVYSSPTDGIATICPLCQSELPDPIPTAAEVTLSLEKITAQLNTVATESPRLREFIDAQENQLADLRRRLNEIRNQMHTTTVRLPDVQNLIAATSRAAEVKGRVSLYLESLEDSISSSMTDAAELRENNIELERLRGEVKRLEEELADLAPEDLLPSILNLISKNIANHAQALSLEYSNLPLRLDLKKLAIVADDPDRGPIPLNRIGSGANWVGYHLATYLALHQWFIHRKRPVPRFLFLDQPTQVYFPTERDEEMRGAEGTLKDDERTVVRRMFEWLVRTVEELAPELQVIVLEHADLLDDWYQNRVVERWRDGVTKLVPLEWIDSEAANKQVEKPSMVDGSSATASATSQLSLFDLL